PQIFKQIDHSLLLSSLRMALNHSCKESKLSIQSVVPLLSFLTNAPEWFIQVQNEGLKIAFFLAYMTWKNDIKEFSVFSLRCWLLFDSRFQGQSKEKLYSEVLSEEIANYWLATLKKEESDFSRIPLLKFRLAILFQRLSD